MLHSTKFCKKCAELFDLGFNRTKSSCTKFPKIKFSDPENLHGVHHGLGLLDAGQVSCGRRGLAGWQPASTLGGGEDEKLEEKHRREFNTF